MEKQNKGMGPGMMQDMMKGMGGASDMWMNMAQQVMGSITGTASMVSYATPELRGLFEEWVRVLEEEIMAFVGQKGKTNPSDIAANLKISQESALYLIGRLAKEGRLIVGEIQVPA